MKLSKNDFSSGENSPQNQKQIQINYSSMLNLNSNPKSNKNLRESSSKK